MDVLVDSNVLIDLFSENSEWYGWSSGMFAELGDAHVLVINPIIYAEVAPGFPSQEALEAALYPRLRREALPWEAAFLAGQCFLKYRRQGGQKRSPLPDFFIGAHAAVTGMTLLTRDGARYRQYFPKLKVIAPE